MKRWISAMMVVALLVSVAPVLAGDAFHALGRLPAALTPLDDAQLASVQGGNVDVCVDCYNFAYVDVYQSIKIKDSTVSEAGGGDLNITQSSTVTVNQEIN